jgi:hypothetical protein
VPSELAGCRFLFVLSANLSTVIAVISHSEAQTVWTLWVDRTKGTGYLGGISR